MIPGKTYTHEDFLWMGWRRKWLIVVPFLVVLTGTLAWSYRLPNLYQSETVILVVPQRVPDTYVRAITTPIEDRLQSISPEILSSTRLDQVIQELNLYEDLRGRLAMEEILQLMREDIDVDPVKGNTFRIRYVSGDPDKAMEVTKRLASMFIDENLREREVLAEGTNQFLESQLHEARARLVQHEQNLAEFRRVHAGELPSQVTSNLQSIQNSQMQLQTLGQSISRDRDRVTLLEGLYADAVARDAAPAAPPAPSLGAADPMLAIGASTADRLEAARRSLAALQTRLTDQHPDILRAKRVIRDLERQAELESQQRRQQSVESSKPLTAAEAARRARLREMEAEIASLRQRITHGEAEQKRLTDLIATYERGIEAAPRRESELAELMRDYETLQSVYSSLQTRYEDSKIAANLERRQVGEQFKILDEARRPEKPFSPNRLKLNAIGAFLGLALGIGLAALIEYRDTSLRTEDDVVSTFALPVVALIPLMVTKDEILQRRRRRLILSGTAAGVLLAVVAATMVAWKAGIL